LRNTPLIGWETCRETKVSDFDSAMIITENILQLQIEMDNYRLKEERFQRRRKEGES
jgi:hypothetical protein